MDIHTTRRFATFKSSGGFEGQGTVLKLDPLAATLEICHPETVLQTSEVLHDFQVMLDDQVLYSGRAIVGQVLNSGPALMCEVRLEASRFDSAFFAGLRKVEGVQERFRSFLQGWQEIYRIRAEYKVTVADLQSYLSSLRQWLEQIELSIRASPTGDRGELERTILEELATPILPVITRFFEELERTTGDIAPDMRAAHQAYLQQQLHPLTLCSPFAHRTYSKPLGYAGDYEVVNMMTRPPWEGGSVFAKILNCWFLRQAPAEAHRNRVAMLQRLLVEETARVVRAGRGARILNLACGPAVEVQRFLEETLLSDRAHIELLDFNAEALSHVRAVLGEVKQRHNRATTFGFLNKPVHQLLKQSSRLVQLPASQEYDFVYCAGLFDYLPDNVCQRLMTLLYSWLAPEGLLLATNVDPCNPIRYGMEQLLDWYLLYRDAARLRGLRPSQVPVTSVEVKSDVTGVNLFLHVRKQQHV